MVVIGPFGLSGGHLAKSRDDMDLSLSEKPETLSLSQSVNFFFHIILDSLCFCDIYLVIYFSMRYFNPSLAFGLSLLRAFSFTDEILLVESILG